MNLNEACQSLDEMLYSNNKLWPLYDTDRDLFSELVEIQIAIKTAIKEGQCEDCQYFVRYCMNTDKNHYCLNFVPKTRSDGECG